MNARIIVLGLTVSITLMMILQSVGLANETLNLSYQPSSAKSLKYDRQMVKEAPAVNKVSAAVSPYTVVSWRSIL